MGAIDVTGLTDEEVMALVTPEMLAAGERTMARLREVVGSLEEDTGQTAYSSLLLPCPFCGGRAWLQWWGYAVGHGMEARVVCGECHVSTSRVYQSGRTTYLPTGEDITRALVLEKAIGTWNRRSERTCRDLCEAPQSFECGACGWFDTDVDGFPLEYLYCPNCGARVVCDGDA